MLNRERIRNIMVDMRKSEFEFDEILQSLGSNHNFNDDLKLLRRLSKEKLFSNKIKSMFFPNSYKKLVERRYFYNDDEDYSNSIEFISSLIVFFMNEINNYIQLKDRYEKSLISLDFNTARQDLKKIEDEFGKSYWSLSQNFIITECLEGYQSNKELLANLTGYTTNSITLANLQFMSYVAEQKMSYDNYLDTYYEFLEPLDNNIVKNFIKYTISIDESKYDCDLSAILQLTRQFSMVDIYETYVDLLINKKLSKDDFKIDELIDLNDKRIINYCFVNFPDVNIDISDYIDHSKEFINQIEKYTKSEYSDFLLFAENYIKENPNNFQVLILYVKALVYSKRSLSSENDLIQNIYNLYNKGNKVKIIKKLRFYEKLFKTLSWKYKISSLLDRKTNYHKDLNLLEVSYLNDYVLTPMILKIPGFDYRQSQLTEVFLTLAPYSTNYLFYKDTLYNSNLVEVENDKKNMLEAEFLAKEGELDKSNTILESLLNDVETPTHRKEKIIRLMYSNYVGLKDNNSAVELVVDSYFESPSLLSRVDMNLLYENIYRTRDSEVRGNICTPIFMNNLMLQDDTFLVLSISNFFGANSIDNKESFFQFFREFGINNKSIEFLSKICSRYLLERDVTLVYDKKESRSLRVEILEFLKENDTSNLKFYNDEIVLLEKEYSIQDRIESINQSKITVDINQIYEKYRFIFGETYDKLLDTLEFTENILGIDVNSESFIDDIKESIALIDNVLKNKDEEQHSYILLRNLNRRITKELLFNSEYGLDKYLSSRIRHGFVESQLTEIFNSHNMLSKISKTNDIENMYNEYFGAQIVAPDLTSQNVLDSLNEFTKNVKEKIDDINSNLLRIKMSDSENGIFDFTRFTLEFTRAYILLTNKPQTFTVYFDRLVTHFWLYLGNLLENIREYLKKDITSSFNYELTTLETKIKSLENSGNRKVTREILRNIVLIRADVQRVVNNFVSVLDKKDVIYKDFMFVDVIDTCIEINSRLFSEFSDNNVKKTDFATPVFNGKLFPHFIDIFNILINNSITHTKFINLSELEIKFSDEVISKGNPNFDIILNEFVSRGFNISGESFARLSISNNISDDENIELLEEKITNLINNLSNTETIKKYSRMEGGSGFYKINNILQSHFDNAYLFFIDINNSTFNVEVILELKEYGGI